MSLEQFPTLQKALTYCESNAEADIGPDLAALIDQDTALNSMIDGLVGGVLETISMAVMVSSAEALQSGKPSADQSKIQLGRAKVIEGLLEMIDSSSAEGFIDANVQVGNGDIGVIDVLREFADYTKSTSPQEEA